MSKTKNSVIGLQKEIQKLKNEISFLEKKNKFHLENDFFLKESQKVAKLGTYVLDLKDMTWTSSEIFDSLYGINKKFDKQLSNWLHLIHPEYRDSIKEWFQVEMIKNKKPFNKEYKIIRYNDGKERWIHGRGKLKYDSKGNAIQIFGTIQDITERKIIEEALYDSENRFKALSEATYEGIFFSVNGYCIEANKAGCRMFGYTYKEMLKLYATDIFTEECKKIVINNILNNYLKPYTVKGLKKDGTVFDVEIQGKIIDYQGKKVRVSAIRDISHRIKSQNELKEKEKKFRTLFENAGDGILIGNNQGIIVDANKSFFHMTGLPKSKVINNHIRTLFSASLLNIKPLRFDLLDEGKSIIIERELVGKNGKLIPIEMNSKRLNEDHYITIMRDLSERKKAEADLLSTNKELIKAKEKAEESDKLKSEFLANMSHEIRTPMNGILGFSKMITNPNLAEEKRTLYSNIIINSSNQLMHIIDDILEISILETKQVKVFSSEVNINELLLEIFSIYEGKAKENGTPLSLKNGLSDNKSLINTDDTKLSKIINNLLDNALRYTSKGYIEIGYKLVDNYLEFYVKDTGIGINPDRFQTIFERFAQEEKTISNKFRGLGLGLSIAKENVEILGGTIRVESEKNKGSVFYFTIPYNPIENNQKKSIEIQPKVPITKSKKSLTVLVAEDDDINFLYIETLLKNTNQNNNILRAKNGKEVVEICQSNQQIDLILMDIKMPVMDGYQTIQKIKKNSSKYKVVAQTAYTSTEDKKKIKKAGFDDFLAKPINEIELFTLIHKYFQ